MSTDQVAIIFSRQFRNYRKMGVVCCMYVALDIYSYTLSSSNVMHFVKSEKECIKYELQGYIRKNILRHVRHVLQVHMLQHHAIT